MDTSTLLWTLLILAIIGLGALGAAMWMRKHRSEELRERFGSEYEQTIEATGSQAQAEKELADRKKRVETFNLRSLMPEERERFTERWRETQAQFVDDPHEAIVVADQLVTEVMQARGYPLGDYEQRAADLSVDHADVISNYRAARAITLTNERGEADTEDLRQAMRHHRAMFDELLEAPSEEPEQKEMVR